MTGLDDKLENEFKRTFREVERETPEVEPTEEERANGWTKESLTEYVREQETAAALRIDPHSVARQLARRPAMQPRHNPLKWRR